MSAIHLTHLRFTVRCLSEVKFRRFAGGALRGGLGRAVRGLVCPDGESLCDACPRASGCAYGELYESRVPDRACMMRLYTTAPRPFVVQPPVGADLAYAAGDAFDFGVVLVGGASSHSRVVADAVCELGRAGVGPCRGRFDLESVCARSPDGWEAVNGREPPQVRLPLDVEQDAPSSLTLDLVTPTRIKYAGRLQDRLDFHVLFRSLLRRVSALGCFYCGQDPPPDPAGLVGRAMAAATVESRLEWIDWPRASARQGQPMRLGGVVGRVRYERVDPVLWPYVRAGQHVHVGKAATFGLGQTRVADPAHARCGEVA